ncbi:MAG: hypothetical protein NVSMB18_24070 [Acetobacteraceae bacterium]
MAAEYLGVVKGLWDSWDDASGLDPVTTFHAARPPLRWSIEASMRATL